MKKTGANKRAHAEASRAFRAWLHDKDDTPITVFFAQVYLSGYRFGRRVEREAKNGK